VGCLSVRILVRAAGEIGRICKSASENGGFARRFAAQARSSYVPRETFYGATRGFS
jgi:hypothetical protein